MCLTIIPISGHTQTSEPDALREFGIRYVVEGGVVRPEVFWEIEVLVETTTFTIVLGEGDDFRFIRLGGDSFSAEFGPLQERQTIRHSVVDTNKSTGDLVCYILSINTSHRGGHSFYFPSSNCRERVRVPGPPQTTVPNFSVDSVTFDASEQSMLLAWGELTGEAAGYTDILGYEIEYRFQGDSWTAVSPAHSDTTRMHNHVLNVAEASRGGLQYRIRATNEITELENGPQGPWSEVVFPTLGAADLNDDGWVGADDMLILYYSLELGDSFEMGTERSTSTAGPLAKTLLGGLLRSTEVTDAEVFAAWARALIVERAEGSAIGGISATNPAVDANDALILYYAAAFRDLLGDGNSGGFEVFRRELLAMPSGLTSPTDEPLKAILRSANEFLAGQN